MWKKKDKEKKDNTSNEVSSDKKKNRAKLWKWLLAIGGIAIIIIIFASVFSPKTQKINITSLPATNTVANYGGDLELISGSETILVSQQSLKDASAQLMLASSNRYQYICYIPATSIGNIEFTFSILYNSSGNTAIQIGNGQPIELVNNSVNDTIKALLTSSKTSTPSPNEALFLEGVVLKAPQGVYPVTNFNWFEFIWIILIALALITSLWFTFKMMKGGMGGTSDLFSMGKSPAKIANTNIKFNDVGGIKEEKFELMEIVDFLKSPAKYVAMGARIPKGVILYGPPGTGKTLLAKAVAGEAKVPFFQTNGSSFEDMLVGTGVRRIKDLFSKARKASPCIVFIDEIDSLAGKRRSNDSISGSNLSDQTLNALLSEMDGFDTKSGVIVMAATNRLDILDEAILRPGRFDRQIQVTLPDIQERIDILKIHAKNKNLSSKIVLEDVARRTPGFSGAQLESVLNEAALLAVRANRTSITMVDIDEGIDRVVGGPAKHSRKTSLEERKQISFHEGGHALVGLYVKGADVVEKITIIPRGKAAGYTVQTPAIQELQIQKKSDLMGLIAATLGGRASEEIIYGLDGISTGASNDLYKATNIVRAMVTQLGMSKLGMTQYVPSEGQQNPYHKDYSDETALAIDQEINDILQERYIFAKQIIQQNRRELELIVESLLILETIDRKMIYYIHDNKDLPPQVIDAIQNLIKTNTLDESYLFEPEKKRFLHHDDKNDQTSGDESVQNN